MRRVAIAAASLLVFLAPPARAAAGAGGSGVPKDIVTARGTLTAAGQDLDLKIELTIAAGWHVNAHELDDEFLIPTVVELKPPEGVTFGDLTYPPPLLRSFEFSPDEKLKVYEGTVAVTGKGKAAKPPTEAVSAKLRYQACNDKQCLPPKTVTFSIPAPAGSGAAAPAADGGAGTPSASAPPTGPGPAASPGSSGDAGSAGRFDLAGRGLLSTLAVVFLGGLLLNLTPCVYPMIPITIGYFGNQAQGSVRRSFGLASFYVLGMALTYSVLGVVAALTGSMFGRLLQSPYVIGGIAALMVALALSSFGLFEIQLPSALTSRAGARKGFLGAFLMGLLMGVVAAPCIGPFVVALLTYVAKLGDPAMGFLLFFVLALGLGTPFLFLAGFSGSLKALPRSGAWMVGVRRIFGLTLLGVALYFVGPLLSAEVFGIAWRLFALGSVVYLLGFEPLGNAPGHLGKAFKSAFAASVFLVFWLAGGFGGKTSESIRFVPYASELVAQAQRDCQPVMVDFTADWCIPCRELEHRTFVDASVREKAKGFVNLRADLTKSTPPEVEELMKRHGVVGPPTVLFLAPDGRELRDLRVEGFLDARAFADRQERARGSAADCPSVVALRLRSGQARS